MKQENISLKEKTAAEEKQHLENLDAFKKEKESFQKNINDLKAQQKDSQAILMNQTQEIQSNLKL